MNNAFEFIVSNNRLYKEDDCPYLMKEGRYEATKVNCIVATSHFWIFCNSILYIIGKNAREYSLTDQQTIIYISRKQ